MITVHARGEPGYEANTIVYTIDSMYNTYKYYTVYTQLYSKDIAKVPAQLPLSSPIMLDLHCVHVYTCIYMYYYDIIFNCVAAILQHNC